MFAEPYCFSMIAQVIIRANAFSSFFFSPETSKIARWPFPKLVLQYCNHLAQGNYSKI